LSFVELDWDKAIQCPKLFEHPVITSIASKHNKTPAQVLLRWATQRDLAIIPKANDPARALENLESISFDLQPEEVQEISSLNKNIRFNNPPDVSSLFQRNVFPILTSSSVPRKNSLYLCLMAMKVMNRIL